MMSETVNAVNRLSPQSVWDQSITLRHIRNAMLMLLVLCALWYVWQFFRLERHSKMGGLPAQTSPYHAEIPDDCNKFLNRHKLQHNNVQWLDADGDGVLNAQDPAFAAIKLWVDINQDGQMQAIENAGLADMGLQSINFKTGEVVYADGGRDVLSAATLHADTEGVRMTQVSEVNAQGLTDFGSNNGAKCPQPKKRALRMRGFRCIGTSGMPPSYTSVNSTSLR